MISRRLATVSLTVICAVGASAQTNFIGGDVTNSVTWSGTNLLSGTVLVRSNVVVTIDPGTRLLMNTAAVLRIEGQLLAQGTSNQPITFTRSTTTTNWGRLFFVRAQPSVLRHCVIEFAQSVGDHQSYYLYTIPCDSTSPPLPRTYREAVVALATHLDLENCTFQNLPYNTGAKEGDAIAIISDDVQFPGPASANVRHCRFTDIGQGVHSRFSPLLVEHCTFSSKNGDNDDIDLYGESTPAPVIRYNTFLDGHEDKINPTRCSALIYGNLVMGSDDHGIVLRDRGRPIVFNNIISNCTAAAISVQNQCDALIAHNTIINCGRGIRLFDHTARHGEPYCLFPGNGKATIINCIIWDWTIAAFAMEQSTFLPYPHITVVHCDVEAGANLIVTNGNNNTVVWGPGNISLDPQFTDALRVRANSPCLDAGTNLATAATNFSLAVAEDFDRIPRPLDGNGDASVRFDIGAYEFLLASADSNGDGIPDGWTWQYRLDPTSPATASGNPDGDPHTTLEEWYADTHPTNALSYFRLLVLSNGPPATVHFLSSSNRQYTLLASTNLAASNSFVAVPGQTAVAGTGGLRSLTDTNPAPEKYYRVGVTTP